MTLKRVRRYALLIGAALWTVFGVDYATPGALDRLGKIKGTDFVQFYASGSLVLSGRTDRLYDFDAHQSAIRAAAPEAREMIYPPIQSPQLVFLLMPLAALPYSAAVAIWTLAIVGLYGVCCVVLWSRCRDLHGYRREAIACAVAFPGLYATVIHGQTSVLALLSIVLALVALERQRGLQAGLALGCLVFKPHWVVAAGVVFLVAREWKVVVGIGVSAFLQLTATMLLVGPRVFSAYLQALLSIGRLGDALEPRPGYALRSLFSVLVPNPTVAFACYLVVSGLVVLVAARIWRAKAGFDVRASALVLALVLVSPHVFEYDLLVLTPVFLLLANAMAAGTPTGLTDARWSWVPAALFVAPVLTAVPPLVRLQFSATAMSAILWRLWSAGVNRAEARLPVASAGRERSGDERELGRSADASGQAEERAADGPRARRDVHVVVARRVEL